MKDNTFIHACLVILLAVAFFIPSFVQGKAFLPADTIVGLYHPYRDAYAANYPNGIPYKNFLITDPVRQQYPWKHLAIHNLKDGSIPLWNPYTFGGTPLLANFQSAVFYPLNALFFLMPFMQGWNLFILLQPLLGSLFLYWYLRNIKLSVRASVFGSFVFAYSGFSIAWLEWGNIGHTALWLPLILLSIDKVAMSIEHKAKSRAHRKQIVLWCSVFTFALTSSFFAGHLQTFFYLAIVAAAYIVTRWLQNGRQMKMLVLFALCSLLFASFTLIQWLPTFQFITESARNLDQLDWQKDGWFIPWQHALQFFAPDIFGNPATLNYFGVWNYAEFIGYIGIIPLIFSFFALITRRDKHTYFFALVLLFSLLFSFPTLLAKLPFIMSLPFISTTQPTRLLFLVDFSLAILAALGIDYFNGKQKSILIPVGTIALVLLSVYGILTFSPNSISLNIQDILVAKRNIQLPILLIFSAGGVIILFLFIKQQKFRGILMTLLLLMTIVDLFRFAGKFLPFTNAAYVFPTTKTIAYLQEHSGNARFMSLDSRILPPNFSLQYSLQSVEGYDPLFLRRYGELIIASERKKPDIAPPFGFNRIITPHEVSSPIINLLGVKYVLTLSDITMPGLTKVMQEGETRIYENTNALPRAFFVNRVTAIGHLDKQRAIEFLFSGVDLQTSAVVEANVTGSTFASGSASILNYTPDKITIETVTEGEGFLVLTDAYYPTWKATLVTERRELPIYRTDYQFRGVVVPAGRHTVEFSNTIFTHE